MSRTLLGITGTGKSILGRGLVLQTCGSYDQHRSIVTRELLQLPEDYPEPWDYRNYGYTYKHMVMDLTTKRFHENSKLIVVEGNIGSGKSKVAKEIADALGFYFMPAFKMDDVLIDRYGNDLRDFYHLFPKRFRTPDANLYYKNPKDDLSAVYQDRMYFCRHEQYMNALIHIVNTGQGVVLENSVFSDFVFANAMRQKDYISREYFQHYYYVRRSSLKHLKLFPHLVVYLDSPVDKCLETIKKRGNTDEINVCDESYLTAIARSYKDFLKELKRHSYILAYDCSKEEITADNVVEDVERMNFDYYEWHSGDVMETWFNANDEAHWTWFRKYITNKVYPRLHSFQNIRQHEVGELYIYPPDAEHFVYVMMLEVLKDYKPYGFTEKDDKLRIMLASEMADNYSQKWSEYFFREDYLDCLHSSNIQLDPYANNYNPDYLKHH